MLHFRRVRNNLLLYRRALNSKIRENNKLHFRRVPENWIRYRRALNSKIRENNMLHFWVNASNKLVETDPAATRWTPIRPQTQQRVFVDNPITGTGDQLTERQR
jgi:hypothetical protein